MSLAELKGTDAIVLYETGDGFIVEIDLES
jgi:hypothetical protein